MNDNHNDHLHQPTQTLGATAAHPTIEKAAPRGSVSSGLDSRWGVALSGLVLAGGMLAGCASSSNSDSSNAADSASSSAADQQCETAGDVQVCDPWVKAADAGSDSHAMTAAFGSLHSTTGQDLHLVSAESEVAGMTQLHETVADGGSTTMREKEGGFMVPADGTLDLQPGGNHIMLMSLQKSLQPGDSVSITLHFEDGSSAQFAAPVRQYTGAKESYTDDPNMQMEDSGSTSTSGDGMSEQHHG
ncbi:copper chaperone PCu(A)C [Pseudoclavibacter sp. 13-3]|uniref:copper chaperone PCu(A)C n=1 Tax=Pseudoclavibacter sp. 13-3 TaxID=2901228 RepID=UPI001E5A3A03|nr:copper chaperone PCu(A)C [Pseudoclavibacter sp. 13-3]MCD7101905.1 copper chaperone PCu(A)C [Pseudoclavibacter sp. 13-3]